MKPADAIDVTAVYEARAHLWSATRAYVMLYVPDERQDAGQGEIDEVAAVARQHRVGLITFADPSNYDTREDLVEAERSQPDPGRLNDLLATRLMSEQREKWVKWSR